MLSLSSSDKNAIEKYWRKAASQESKALWGAMENNGDLAAKHPWQRVSVLPICRESVDCLKTLNIPEAEQHLLIVVANRPASQSIDKHQDWLQAWQQTLQLSPNTQIQLRWHANAGAVLWLDCATQCGLPDDGGVGLARKIGCDLATMLITKRHVVSPWIHSLDADAQLPGDYFNHTDHLDDYAAVVYPFQHVGSLDCPNHRATLVYEWHILRYALGLKRAGSLHAWVALGSAMAFHAADYARVRGFPVRAAGEDFYLLSKLSKVRPVRSLAAQPIRIQSRVSDRVPFGTGPAAQRIGALRDELDWPSRHPGVFEALRQYKQSLIKSIEEPAYEQTLDRASRDAISRARAASPELHRQQRHLMSWFDAFRELKLIHHFRDTLHADQPVRTLLQADKESSLNLNESQFDAKSMADLQKSNQRMLSGVYDNGRLGAASL